MLCGRDGRPVQRRPNQIYWVDRVNWETSERTGSCHYFSLAAGEQALAESLRRCHLSSSKACGSRYCRGERPPLGYGDNSWTPTYPATDDWAGHMIRMKDEITEKIWEKDCLKIVPGKAEEEEKWREKAKNRDQWEKNNESSSTAEW